MPKKKVKETQAEQSARFQAEVERLVEDGDLNPADADETLNRLMANLGTGRSPP